MRWKMGTGLIGGCGCHAVISGVVAEIGPARKFDPVNPCDIGAVVLQPLLDAMPPFSRFSINPLAIGPNPYYPMTGHQRRYKWPDTGVGPIRYFDEQTGWSVSKPPVEVAAVQNDWPTLPVCSVPIAPSDANAPVPRPALITETVLPQRGNSTREYWTLYQTAPWANTAFIKNVLLEGNSQDFAIQGVTRTSAGVPLAGVRVICVISPLDATPWEYKTPFVREAYSDAAGNYKISVQPQPRYQLTAYHEATEVGGITVDHLAADTTVDIYCTQPGVAPPVSGGSVVITNRITVR